MQSSTTEIISMKFLCSRHSTTSIVQLYNSQKYRFSSTTCLHIITLYYCITRFATLNFDRHMLLLSFLLTTHSISVIYNLLWNYLIRSYVHLVFFPIFPTPYCINIRFNKMLSYIRETALQGAL